MYNVMHQFFLIIFKFSPVFCTFDPDSFRPENCAWQHKVANGYTIIRWFVRSVWSADRLHTRFYRFTWWTHTQRQNHSLHCAHFNLNRLTSWMMNGFLFYVLLLFHPVEKSSWKLKVFYMYSIYFTTRYFSIICLFIVFSAIFIAHLEMATVR